MKIHIVQKKDTLQSIIAMYQVSKEEIEKENPHLSDVQQLLPGMKLKIPTASVQVMPKQIRQTEQKEQTQQAPETEKIQQPQQKKTTTQQADDIKGTSTEKGQTKILYAQTHLRPMGTAISTDAKQQRPIRQNENTAQNERSIHGVCCHCHQPIFTPHHRKIDPQHHEKL